MKILTEKEISNILDIIGVDDKDKAVSLLRKKGIVKESSLELAKRLKKSIDEVNGNEVTIIIDNNKARGYFTDAPDCYLENLDKLVTYQSLNRMYMYFMDYIKKL